MLDTSSPFAPPPPAPSSEMRIDVATRRLRKAIVACELIPGAFVHEAALAERFGLGRAGIRVALTELASSGFVSRHARQGWRIAPVDGALVEALVDGRRRLEPSLAEQSLDDQTRGALIGAVGVMESVSGRSEPGALALARATERQVRDLLATKAGAFARLWLRDLWDHAERITRFLELAGYSIPPADLRPLVEALASGDRKAALRAIRREHTCFGDALTHGFLEKAELLAPPAARSARKRVIRSTVHSQDNPKPSSKELQR